VLDPSVAVDGSNNVYVVWSEGTNEIMLRKSTDGGQTFSDPVNVSNTPGASVEPQIAIDGKGKIYVVWQENVGGKNREIFLSSSTDGGKSFSTAVNVSNDPTQSGRHKIGFGEQVLDESFGIAVDKEGNVLIVWTDLDKEALLFSRSTDGGKTFSAPLELPKGKTLPRLPDVAADNAGNIYVAWANGGGESGDISLIKSPDGGKTWSDRLNISDNEGFSDTPDIAINTEGHIFIVGDDSTDAGDLAHIRFARSTDGGQTFSKFEPVSPPLFGAFPAITVDNKGNPHVAFFVLRRGGGVGFTCSTDNGSKFVPSIEIPDTGPALSFLVETEVGLIDNGTTVSVAADSEGNIYVASARVIRGQKTQILLSKGKCA